MATELGVAYLSLLPEMRGFRPAAEKGMGKVGKGVATRFGVGFNGAIGSIVSRSAGIFAAGFASVKVGGFLKDAIGQASDLGETTSKVGQIFGPAAKDILAFSKTSSTALGQTQQAALDANATFGIFGKAAGLQGKELSGFTTNLTTLASDLASFNNTSPEQAIEAIGAALRGETEPMRAYGVLLDDASLRQEALAQDLIKTTKQALTPQQKVLAAQALIMKQTTTAQGDFARTSGGLANQQRILSARFSDFKTSIGAVALPLVTRLFGFLNDKAVPVLGEIRGGIVAFGAAFKANDGDITSSGFPGFMERVGFIAAQAFGIFKSQVLPRLKEFGGYVASNVVPAVRNLITAFTPLAKNVGGAVVSVFQKLEPAAGALGSAFAAILPAFKSFTGFLRNNQTLIGALAVGIAAIVVAFKAYQGVMAIVVFATKAWAAIQAVMNVVLAANPIGIIVLALVGLAAGLVYAYKHSETFRNIVNGVFNSVKGVVLGVVNALVTAFHAVVGAVTWTVNGVRTVWSAIVGAVSGPLNAIVGFLKAVWARVYPIIALPVYIAIGLIKGYLAQISAAFTVIKNWVVGAFSKAWSAVTNVLSGPINAAKKFIGDRIADIKYAFNVTKDWALGAFSKAWSGLTAKLTGPINTAKTAFGTILGTAKGGVQWVFSQAVSAIGRIWDSLQEVAKKPIRFIVNTVLNDGLIGAFNWVAGKFQAPTIPTVPLPKGFASGGHFDGRLPGKPSAVDNMFGMSAAGPVGLATGEFITNAKDTARALPLLRHINDGGELPGFANGGLFGKMKDSITGAFNAGKSFGQDALGFLSDPVKWFKERLSGPLNRMAELGNSPYAEVVKAVPRNLVDAVSAKAKDLLGIGGGSGGPINPGLGGALNWARSQVGKPYIWGGVGPAGYDCSGFMSAIVNVIRGSNPFQRLFATGSLPAGLFAPGPGAFELGWFTGNPGHVAGTLNGVDVESRGGRGVVVGPGARGAHDSLFNRHGHLVGYANGGIVGDPPFDELDPRGKAYRGKAVLPRSALSFDSGGMLPTGYSMVHNGTGKPEPVGHDFLRKDDLNGMRFVLDAGGVGELTGYVQVTAQNEIKESNRAVRRKVGR